MNNTIRSIIVIVIIILIAALGFFLINRGQVEPDETNQDEITNLEPVDVIDEVPGEVKGESDEQKDWIIYKSKNNNFEFKYPGDGEVVDCPPIFENSFCVELSKEADTTLKSKLLVVSEPEGFVSCFDPIDLRGIDQGTEDEPGSVTLSSGIFTHDTHLDGTAGTQYENLIYSPLHGSICMSFYFVLQTSEVPTDDSRPLEFDRDSETKVFNQILETFFSYSK